MEENPWKTLDTRIPFENPWVKLIQNDVIHPSGEPGEYTVVHFKNIAVGVVPMDEAGNIWLVGQYRYPLSQYSWEIPEGGCPEGSEPLDTAKRELLEETGIVAEQYFPLFETHLSNSAADEFGIVYLARTLSFHEAQPEGSEALAIRKVHFDEFFAMVEKGEITDALSMMAAWKLKVLMYNNELP